MDLILAHILPINPQIPIHHSDDFTISNLTYRTIKLCLLTACAYRQLQQIIMGLITSVHLITTFSIIISSYYSVICSVCINSSVNVIIHSDTRSTAWKVYLVTMCTSTYMYFWAPCFGKQLSLHTDEGNAHNSYHVVLLW